MVKKPAKPTTSKSATAKGSSAKRGSSTTAQTKPSHSSRKPVEPSAATKKTSKAAESNTVSPTVTPPATASPPPMAKAASSAEPVSKATKKPVTTSRAADTKPMPAKKITVSEAPSDLNTDQTHDAATQTPTQPDNLGADNTEQVTASTPTVATNETQAEPESLDTTTETQESMLSDFETIEPPIPEDVIEDGPSSAPAEEQEPHYIPPPLHNKYLNKEALRDRLWLRKEFKPIISYVGRLDMQKGVHLIRHGIFFALNHGAQFILLGTSPEHRINEEFWGLKHHLNDNPDCHIEIGFNEELSHLIYAGSDMMIMPSLYEPCGLAQMIALKYGTVPIVRAVGGLADTVFDRDYSHKPYHERNGYVFSQADATGLESAMHRAIGLWYSYPDEFRQLVIQGMRYDYSWNHPAQHYLNIYDHIRCK